MTDQPPAPPLTPPAQDGKTQEQRMTAIETEQREQRGILEQIRDAIKPGNPPPGPAPTGTPPAAPPAPDMAEQMRQAVREVNAERDQAAAGKTPPPEKTPREVTIRGRDRLRRVFIGPDDPRR